MSTLNMMNQDSEEQLDYFLDHPYGSELAQDLGYIKDLVQELREEVRGHRTVAKKLKERLASMDEDLSTVSPGPLEDAKCVVADPEYADGDAKNMIGSMAELVVELDTMVREAVRD